MTRLLNRVRRLERASGSKEDHFVIRMDGTREEVDECVRLLQEAGLRFIVASSDVYIGETTNEDREIRGLCRMDVAGWDDPRPEPDNHHSLSDLPTGWTADFIAKIKEEKKRDAGVIKLWNWPCLNSYVASLKREPND